MKGGASKEAQPERNGSARNGNHKKIGPFIFSGLRESLLVDNKVCESLRRLPTTGGELCSSYLQNPALSSSVASSSHMAFAWLLPYFLYTIDHNFQKKKRSITGERGDKAERPLSLVARSGPIHDDLLAFSPVPPIRPSILVLSPRRVLEYKQASVRKRKGRDCCIKQMVPRNYSEPDSKVD